MRQEAAFLVLAVVFTLAVQPTQAQTNAPVRKSKSSESPAVVVDKVVANPKKFKGIISVTGRVGETGLTNGLFALGCKDACVSMPVKFSGTPPQPRTDVIVRGQITKDAKGRYLFDAESVTAKK